MQKENADRLQKLCHKLNVSFEKSYRFSFGDPDDFYGSSMVAQVVANGHSFRSDRYAVQSTNLYHRPPPPFDQNKVDAVANLLFDICAGDALENLEQWIESPGPCGAPTVESFKRYSPHGRIFYRCRYMDERWITVTWVPQAPSPPPE